MTSIP